MATISTRFMLAQVALERSKMHKANKVQVNVGSLADMGKRFCSAGNTRYGRGERGVGTVASVNASIAHLDGFWVR